MSSTEIMNSSDDEIFIIKDTRPVYEKVHYEVEDFESLQHKKKKPSPTQKASKKRKRGNEKTNTTLGERGTKSTISANVLNQASEKAKKIRQDSCVKNKNISVDTDVEQTMEKTNLQSSKESTSTSGSVINCSPSKISYYLKTHNVTPKKQDSSKKQTEAKSVEISPTIAHRKKRFLMEKLNCKSSPQTNCRRKIFNNCLSNESSNKLKTDSPSDDSQESDFSFTTLCETDLETITHSNKYQDSTNITIEDIGEQMKGDEPNYQNIEILCDILNNIIRDELKKQVDLRNKEHIEGNVIENLLSDEEIAILNQFFLLEKNACKLYVRMLLRKKGLYRVSAINFKDVISADLEKEFKVLEKENFVNVNTDEEDLQTQMNLLNVSDISKLCKNFKVSTKNQNKSDLICSLIENCKKQKSIVEAFGKKKGCSRLELLKENVKSYLGMCIKLNESVKSAFQKIFLLFSFAHYQDSEEKRISDQLYMCFNVRKKYIKFPQYDLTPTVIFQCRGDFLQYEKALWMNDSLDVAMDSKNYEDVFSIAKEAKGEFNKILNDNDFQKRFLNLQPFLMKFSAGSVYARILTKYCTKLKRNKDNNEVISIIRMLLGQNLFLTSKRGEWYEILSQAFLNLKNNEAAIEVLIKSQKDSFVNEVQKFNLQLKGQVVLKKGKEFQDIDKNELDLLTVSIQEPSSIEIISKVMEGNKAGYKSIFIEESENSTSYTSVEERALSYYKSNGFPRGCHGENYIVKTIYFLLFNDIIYGPSPPGAFQTAYQQHPLDFYSKSFYSYRKESIDFLLDEMCKWTKEVAEEKLTTSYLKNFDVHGMMNWGNHFKVRDINLETLKMFVEFLECITMPVFIHICRRLIENFRVYSSGFPDLTLWNPESKTCKFVEVKGPKDKLSPAQRIWLNFLKINGIDCEVCYVKCNLGRKSTKKK